MAANLILIVGAIVVSVVVGAWVLVAGFGLALVMQIAVLWFAWRTRRL